MKTRILLAAIAGLSLVSGCTNANSKQEATNIAPASSVIVSTVPVTSVAATLTPEVSAPADKPVNTEVAPPKDIKLSTTAAEIAKLAHAGVDSSVMLSYVTNSTHMFGLGADEIVYLNDIGMNPEVMSAMIRHDQIIREASLAGATVTSPTTPAPGKSVWAGGQAGAPPNTWQQPVAELAPVAQAETVTTAVPPPAEERPQEVTVNYFYDSLAPYGTWIDIGGYGRCWRPTIAVGVNGWRPYSHGGRWVWTDRGWYWYSDYSWGWAPFHYGRWFSHSRWGWCWMPDTTWGPSWVSWRYSDSYCGWAPLPPAACYTPSVGFTYYGNRCESSFSFGLTWDSFTFISYNNWHNRRYDRDCVPRHQANQVFNNTTVVNNIIVGNNNVIVNQGIAPSRITAATGTPIRQVPVRDSHAPRGPRRHEELATDGSSLNIVRASVPGPARTATHVSTPPPAPTAPVPPAPTTTRATPQAPGGATTSENQPNTPRGPRVQPTRNQTASTPAAAPVQATVPSATVQPATVPGTVTPATTPGVRDPRTDRTPRGSLAIRPARTEPAPAAQVPAATPAGTPVRTQPVAASPVTPRTDRSQATPWLNNTPAQTAPAASQQPYEATYGQSPRQPQQPERQAPIRNWQQQSGGQRSPTTRTETYQSQTPSQPAYVAPQAPATVRSYPTPPSSPRYEQPTPRVNTPSQPSVPAYTPPPRSTPAPQAPSYTPPPRSAPSAPAYTPPSQPSSPPPSAPARSEPRSSQSGSGSGRGSDDSKQSPPSRGR